MSKNRKAVKSAAFFDLERTITKHAVEREIYMMLYRMGKIPLSGAIKTLWGYTKYGLGILHDLEAMRHEAAMAHCGYDAAESRAVVKRFFDAHLKRFIYREAIGTIDEFRRTGTDVYIVSTTISIYIEPYAEYLGIMDYYGVRLEERDGRFTGLISGIISHQENKAVILSDIAAREGIDLSMCYAFGDSINDRYMLEAVGNPRAVNPDGKLRALARAKGWPVLRWNSLNGTRGGR
jgi:HAD superfamily hydrolase (TIGR01490 family)